VPAGAGRAPCGSLACACLRAPHRQDWSTNEIQAFQLFDLGWSIEEAAFKLGMSQAEVSLRFEEWARMRGEREKIQAELLKKCLRRHVGVLQEQILWRATKGALEEAKMQLEHCRRMLIDPSKLTEEERGFLLTEYSYLV